MYSHLLRYFARVILLNLCLGQAIPAELHVTPEGNDASDGTLSTPLKTVQRACDAAKAGDTIFLHGGTYREGVVLKGISGTDAAPITIAAFKA